MIKYKEISDKELWEWCRLDDERAYEVLFCRHFNRMLRIASKYVRDTMQARELVMDVFFKLWDKRKRITINGEFLNYLSRCVYHSVVSHLYKKIPKRVDLDRVENTHQAGHYADSSLLYEEIQEMYDKALEKLSPRRREAFLLSRHENLSYGEIAQKMNVSVNAVEHYIVAALQSFRTDMKGYISILLLFLFLA